MATTTGTGTGTQYSVSTMPVVLDHIRTQLTDASTPVTYKSIQRNFNTGATEAKMILARYLNTRPDAIKQALFEVASLKKGLAVVPFEALDTTLADFQMKTGGDSHESHHKKQVAVYGIAPNEATASLEEMYAHDEDDAIAHPNVMLKHEIQPATVISAAAAAAAAAAVAFRLS